MWRGLTAGAATALALAAAASAAPPDGFYQSKPLTVRAAKISGKPIAKVYCARTVARWDSFVMIETGDSGWGVNGLTNIATRETALAPHVCRNLENHLRGRAIRDRPFSWALHTFVHETLHIVGIRNERVAECRSLRMLSAVARRYFGVKNRVRARGLRTLAARVSYC